MNRRVRLASTIDRGDLLHQTVTHATDIAYQRASMVELVTGASANIRATVVKCDAL